jgi:uncharacterized iron-regulated membrane protein
MKFRAILFWVHLGVGVSAGLLILMMAVSGSLLAYEKQVVTALEKKTKKVVPPAAGVSRLSLDLLAAKAEGPDRKVTILSLSKDPEASLSLTMGREGVLYMDPYSGEVIGRGAVKARAFFHWAEDWHRWFGMEHSPNKEAAHQVKAAANLLFLAMILSGLYLWWPRPKAKFLFKFTEGLKGRAKDWNQHNVLGFWASWLLLIITLTGLVMSYDWANRALFKLAGSPPPPPRQVQRPPDAAKGGQEAKKEKPTKLAGFEAYLATVEKQVPGWETLSFKLPRREGDKVMALIEEKDGPHAYARSSLQLDPTTAAVVKWESYQDQSQGRKFRGLVKPLHTGELGGLFGQTLAALASLAAIWMVWTGFAMAWRRFFPRKA